MQSKVKEAVPAYVYGKIFFEFFNNDDVNYKYKVLKEVTKELQERFNVSVVITEYEQNNPERGMLGIAAVGVNLDAARKVAKNVLDEAEKISAARIVDESWTAEEY